MKDQKHILTRYRHYRKIATQLATRFVRALPKEAFNDSAQELGLLKKGTIVLENEQETGHPRRIFASMTTGSMAATWCRDYWKQLLHRLAPTSFSCIRRWPQLSTRFSASSPGNGRRGESGQLAQGRSHFVADIQFGKTATVGLGLAMRLIPLPEFHISSGAALPIVGSGASKIRRELDSSFNLAKTEFADLSPEQQHRWLRSLSDQRWQGLSSRIRFAELDQAPAIHHRTEGSLPPRSSRFKIGAMTRVPAAAV